MRLIGVIGQGFVGSALRRYFAKREQVISYDVKEGMLLWGGENLLEWSGEPYETLARQCELIFVCLPTPMCQDGSCDTSLVWETIAKLEDAARETGRRPTVAIKSTVPPGTTAMLAKSFLGLEICHTPEFLREETADLDVENIPWVMVGGSPRAVEVVKQAFKDKEVFEATSGETEMAKYIVNCILALKVAFANEVARLCERMDIDYPKAAALAQNDPRVGESHWKVPGPDNHRGFGGSCFVKDLNALITLGQKEGLPFHTLQGAWDTNIEVRPERDWEQLKGRAVR